MRATSQVRVRRVRNTRLATTSEDRMSCRPAMYRRYWSYQAKAKADARAIALHGREVGLMRFSYREVPERQFLIPCRVTQHNCVLASLDTSYQQFS